MGRTLAPISCSRFKDSGAAESTNSLPISCGNDWRATSTQAS